MMAKGALEEERDQIRGRLAKYSRWAFECLPRCDRPTILDVGCGSGVTTLELAKWSGGSVVALDIDSSALNRLAARAEAAGLADRVTILKRSLVDMDFPADSFDIIWAEGSIWVIGFDVGLRDWGRFLAPGGFLVVHDETGDLDQKRRQIDARGYELLDWMTLDQDAWWAEYCVPLEKLVAAGRLSAPKDREAQALLDGYQHELDLFEQTPAQFHSTIFVMTKRR